MIGAQGLQGFMGYRHDVLCSGGWTMTGNTLILFLYDDGNRDHYRIH
jgi:hypothetical protein